MSTAELGDVKVGFIGGGNMAEAICRGLLAGGHLPAAQVFCSDPTPERRELFQQAGCQVTEQNQEVAAQADVLLLAVKPQVMEAVVRDLADSVNPNCLIVSIAAGVTTASLEAWLPEQMRVIRVMPNTPILVGRGLSGIARGRHATSEDSELTIKIFASGGFAFEVISEEDLHAVTAVSGSGPAYVFRFVEALQQAAQKAGLSADLAAVLAKGTVAGAAHLLMESGEDPAELRQKVTSKGGTTAAALQTLEDLQFEDIITQAVASAKDRSVELSQPTA